MTDMPEIELPRSDNSHGSGSGTSVGYKVEVRTSYWSPTVLDNFTIDSAWRVLPIRVGATQWGMNVPTSSLDREMASHGAFSFAVAEAHRWAFLAALEAQRVGGSLCIQTRMVQVEYKWTYSLKETGVSEALKDYSRAHGQHGLAFKPRNAPIANEAKK